MVRRRRGGHFQHTIITGCTTSSPQFGAGVSTRSPSARRRRCTLAAERGPISRNGSGGDETMTLMRRKTTGWNRRNRAVCPGWQGHCSARGGPMTSSDPAAASQPLVPLLVEHPAGARARPRSGQPGPPRPCGCPCRPRGLDGQRRAAEAFQVLPFIRGAWSLGVEAAPLACPAAAGGGAAPCEPELYEAGLFSPPPMCRCRCPWTQGSRPDPQRGNFDLPLAGDPPGPGHWCC